MDKDKFIEYLNNNISGIEKAIVGHKKTGHSFIEGQLDAAKQIKQLVESGRFDK